MPEAVWESRVTAKPRPFGINLVANVSSSVGLGLTARNMAKVFEKRGVPFSVFDVPHPWGTKTIEPEIERHQVRSIDEFIHPINLYVLPTVFLHSLFEQDSPVLAKGSLHVANLWWEASRIPEQWIPALSRFDALLAMSPFIAEIIANVLPMTPVISGEHPLCLPQEVGPDRGRWGFRDDETVFVSSLDPNSDPARKNPFDLIRAFRQAFPSPSEKVRLLIRLNNADTDLGRSVVAQLNSLGDDDVRITLLLAPMSYPDVLCLYASADVFVSLHRGEGLGLGLMEAMALGKPLIATAWSGNMSFMNYGNSAPVRYRLTGVAGHWDFFQPAVIGDEARWAAPVVEDATSWMQALHADRGLRASIGNHARADIARYQERAWAARWIDELAALNEVRMFLPRVVEKYSFI